MSLFAKILAFIYGVLHPGDRYAKEQNELLKEQNRILSCSVTVAAFAIVASVVVGFIQWQTSNSLKNLEVLSRRPYLVIQKLETKFIAPNQLEQSYVFENVGKSLIDIVHFTSLVFDSNGTSLSEYNEEITIPIAPGRPLRRAVTIGGPISRIKTNTVRFKYKSIGDTKFSCNVYEYHFNFLNKEYETKSMNVCK